MCNNIIVILITATIIHAKASQLRPGPYTAGMSSEPAKGPTIWRFFQVLTQKES